MSKKRTYKTVDVKHVDLMKLLALLPAMLVIVAVDVAKEKPVAALANPQGQTQMLVRFTSPTEFTVFLDLLKGLLTAGRKVELTAEPTGTYGDALCHLVHALEIPVYLINPKRTHDAAEVYDGVPSQHDAKDATVLARLHAQGLGKRWHPAPAERVGLRALVKMRDIYADPLERLHGQMEALLARHWPEFQLHLDVRKQSSALKLLGRHPNPATLDAQVVEQELRRDSHGLLKEQKIEAVLQSAATTQGVAMEPQEQELIAEMAQEMLRLTQKISKVDAQIRQALEPMEQAKPLRQMLGAVTTAVVLAYVGFPAAFHSPAALEKAMGLNLRESSSGKQTNRGVHITKRGPGIVRKYLYLATMRWIRSDEVAKAWYTQRSGYGEKSKGKALVALMRKKVKAIWQVGQGHSYQAHRLFDVRRLHKILGAQPGGDMAGADRGNTAEAIGG